MKSQKGQSLVETALIIPVLLMLLFGITDFARVFHVYLTLDHAGREAARVASVGAADAEIIAEILDAGVGLNKDKLEVKISPNGKEKRVSGSDVSIEMSYPVDFLTPIVGQIVGTFQLENTTVMRVE